MRATLLFLILYFYTPVIFSQKTGLETSGDILQFALPATALTSSFFYKSNDKPYWQFIKSYAVTVVSVHTLKRLINKPRPNGGKYSFPSGHTASAFSGAAFLQRRYGWKIGITAYLLASYTGYTRIKANKHDIYDVAAGAGIGILNSYIFVKPYKKSGKTLSINILKCNRYYIASLNYRF